MLRRLFFVLAFLTASAWAEAIPAFRTVLAIRSTPPATAPLEARFLIGPDPGGAWANRSGSVTTKTGNGWKFELPVPGEVLLDLETKELYSYIGGASNVGLWPGSPWASLTRARNHAGTIVERSYAVSRRDDGAWVAVYPIPEATITLPNPHADKSVQGMSFVVESADDPIAAAGVFVVAGGGRIRLPDGSTVTNWTLPTKTGEGEHRVFRLTAGTSFSSYEWYVSHF